MSLLSLCLTVKGCSVPLGKILCVRVHALFKEWPVLARLALWLAKLTSISTDLTTKTSKEPARTR